MPTTVLVDLAGTSALDGSLPPGMVDAVAALNEFDDASGAPIEVAFTGSGTPATRAAFNGASVRSTSFADVLRATGSKPADTIAVISDDARAADARGHGMHVLQIGGEVRAWADVPGAVAAIVDPADTERGTFERSLSANGQIAGEPGAAGSTHHRDGEGRLRRDRFRAF